MKPRITSMIWNISNDLDMFLPFRGMPKTTNQNKKKRISKNEDSISSLWDNDKRSNIPIIGVPEGEEKEEEIGTLFETIMKKKSLIW